MKRLLQEALVLCCQLNKVGSSILLKILQALGAWDGENIRPLHT